jgi:hypothetical protein
MMKTVLIAVGLIAGLGFAVAQDQVPGNKSEAATPAPSAQQNAPPDKVAPDDRLNSTKAPPDAKAERDAPTLKMESTPQKTSPGGQEKSRPPP